MKYKLERKFLDAGLKKLERDTWDKILNAMIDDFQKLIGCDFEKNINLNIYNPFRVSVYISMWTKDETIQRKLILTPTWLDIIDRNSLNLKDNNSRSLIKWHGNMWVSMCDLPEENNESNYRNLFYADMTLFLFDPITEKRLSLETGESLVEFHFQRNPQGGSKWISLGWQNDIYGEWEYLDTWE